MSIQGAKTILFPDVETIKTLEDAKNVLRIIMETVEEINRKLRADTAMIAEVIPTESGEGFYFGDQELDTTDPYAGPNWINGAWRLRQEGAHLIFEKKEAGAWVRKGAIIP